MRIFNQLAFVKAQNAIAIGQVDKSVEPWSFTPANGDTILGDARNFTEYSKWFFMQDDDLPLNNKGRYQYPIGKGGKIYLSALRAAMEKAGQVGNGEVMEAVQTLLNMFEPKPEEGNSVTVQLEMKTVGGQEPPEFIQLLPHGSHDTVKGPFVFNEESAKLIIAHFDEDPNDYVIDYEHQTLTMNEAPAAGWIKALEFRGKAGLWARVEWTPRATQLLKGREYRYLSPVFLKDKASGLAKRLINAALTNMPAIHGMVPIVAKETGSLKELVISKEDVMNKKLLSLLGLDEDATEAEMLAAVNALKKGKKTANDALIASEAVVTMSGNLAVIVGAKDGTDIAGITGSVMAMKQSHEQVATLTSEKETLQARVTELEGADVEKLVMAALEAGKILSTQKDEMMAFAKSNPAGFETFIAKALPVVPTGPGKKPASKVAAGDDALESDEAIAVMKSLGVTPKFIEDNPGIGE